MSSQSRLIPVTLWNNYFDWPSVSALRWLVFNEHQNGFHVAVRRVGRRVLIDEVAFRQWVEEQSQKKT